MTAAIGEDPLERKAVLEATLNLLGIRGLTYEMGELEEQFHLEREDGETVRTMLALWVQRLLDEGRRFAG